jgi:HTH-type transcriptional regulator / antitoxin HigA
MSLSFNSAKYQELLAEYQPKLIKTEAENEHALISVEKLIHLPNRGPEQDSIYELLIILVENSSASFINPTEQITLAPCYRFSWISEISKQVI